MPVGIAAGHPATVAAGMRILEDGGTAADAAVAATLASCVAETVMTGLAGGGHAIHWDARRATADLLDFFVAVPGRGGGPVADMVAVEIPFGSVPVRYLIGAASCGVPGVPAGCDALWRRWGKLSWPRLVEPALRLARRGVAMPPAHADCLAMLAPVLTRHEGAAIYAPRGRPLRTGERLRQPGLVHTLERLSQDGAATFYRGSVGEALLDLLQQRGGAITRRDLDAYEVAWREPDRVGYAGTQVLSRRGLSAVLDTLPRLPALASLDPAGRALAMARALGGNARISDTTNVVATDGAGNACVVTTSLGLGSGDWLPGYDIHLNSMLGEVDLHHGEPVPGERMGSMMAPTVAVDGDGLVLAAGAAGGTRIRSALVQVLAAILDEGVAPDEAVERPRLHPVDDVVHAEPGIDEGALQALEGAGFQVRRWPGRHHYFGGVSVIGRAGSAGDPRRDGGAASLPP
ncbi:MAG: gamma-glutamyltransferase family protein [Actinomycetota bacterium]|nr:gamma-glutamyltransferase family protein [Actinomycetota bacterium]MDQ3529475.1 gamma-glutamyltransferase family protein [Actinomycetota bacterium]